MTPLDATLLEVAAALDELADGIIIAAADGRLVFMNDAARGYASSPLANETLEAWFNAVRFLAPDQKPLAFSDLPAVRALRGEGAPASASLTITRRNGETRSVLLSARPSKDAAGAKTGVVALLKDVTAEAAARAERDALLRRLHDSNDELRELATVASHDLRAPMRKIRMYAERLARENVQLPQSATGYLERIEAIAVRGTQLVDGVLNCTRLAADAMSWTPVDLGELVSEAVADLRAELDAIGGEVDLGALPTIEGDATLLRQLFQNLLANCVKYRSARPLRVRISAHDAPPLAETTRAVAIRVSDNGRGFRPDEAGAIFRMFVRLRRDGDDEEGLGVGLAICRRVVARHAGTITAAAVPDGGATFEATLPFTQQRTR